MVIEYFHKIIGGAITSSTKLKFDIWAYNQALETTQAMYNRVQDFSSRI